MTKRRLRHVALFVTDLEGGGAERMMVHLAAGIAALGVRVDLVLARAQGPYLAGVPASVRVVDLHRPGTAAAMLPLAAYLRRTAPQILLSTLHHASLAAAVTVRLAMAPTLHFIREANTPSGERLAWHDLKGRGQGLAMRWAYADAAGVVAVSEGVADDLRRHRGVPETKLWTLYNPVVTPEVSEGAEADPGHAWFAPGGPPVVLGVGSLQPRKGFLTLLDAFARLRATREARLVVLGEGPQRADLLARAQALGVAADVDLPGFQANPFAFMARAGVFVLASDREGLPGALIQAMACGCPVVATDCRSGPREILEGGRHGALVQVGDADAMRRAIERTLADPPPVDALKARAAHFGAERVIAAHADVFERALGARAERSAPRAMGA